MLQIKEVRKEYRTGELVQKALDGVTLTLRNTEFVAILGPSGSGKTTLLNIIGGLDRYDSGDLVINGISTKEYHDRDWDAYRNHTIGFVFQSYNLIPHQTILSNVELALTISGISSDEKRERAIKALESVGLGDQLHKKPNQMSGGQMQRVAIARALVNEPDIILADEPTGALDSDTGVQIMELLKKVAENKLVIMVTHNPELAKTYATRIIKLKDGSVIADSAPEESIEAVENATSPKRTKLDFRTALGLSLQNLMTKKGRTFLTAFAGAIGIIGIALIMSLSNGMNDYISSMESDIMGSYPIQLEKETIDLSSMMENMPEKGPEAKTEEKDPNRIYSDNIVADTVKSTKQMTKENDLGKFKQYLEENIKEVENDIAAVEYGYQISPQVFRQQDNDIVQVSPASLLSEESAPSAMTMNASTGTAWSQLVSDQALRKSQYTLLSGEWPSDYDEVALVVTENNEVSDFVLYTLGVMDIDHMNDLVEAAENGEEYEDPQEFFSFEAVIGREYQVFAPCEMYDNGGEAWIDKTEDSDYIASIFDRGITVKITGILQAGDGAEINNGIAYDSRLTEKLMEITASSEIVKEQLENPDINVLTGKAFEENDKDEDEDDSEQEGITKDSAKNVSFYKAVDANGKENIHFASQQKSEHENAVISTEYSVNPKTEVIGYRLTGDSPKAEDTNSSSGSPEDASGETEEQPPDNVLPPSEKTYTVTFQNYDGTVLLRKTACTPEMTITNLLTEDPIREATETAEYIFIGWRSSITGGYYTTAELPTVTEDVTYTAMYYEQSLSANGEIPGMTLPDNFDISSLTGYSMPSFSAMNLSNDQLSVLLAQMSDTTPSTREEVWEALGYVTADQPSTISLYPLDFDSKEKVEQLISDYNEQVKQDADKVTYTDMIGMVTSSITSIINTISYILMAFVAISLVVSSIMIAIITYISVLERTREIGVLRAMGASKNDVSKIFNAETVIEGLISGILGIVVTLLLCIPINFAVYHKLGVENIASLPLSAGLILIMISIFLTLAAGFAPSRIAAKKDPVTALRSE